MNEYRFNRFIQEQAASVFQRFQGYPILIVLLPLCLVTVHCRAQGIITFDGPPIIPPASGYFVQEYFEAGMWFRPLGVIEPGNGFGRRTGGSSLYPDNGTTYVQTSLSASLQFSFTNGSVFDLISVDLAEYSTVVSDAATVQFIGYRPDGGTITESFTTDGIIDGTGPLADFETFTFKDFTGVIRVEVPGFGWSLDNLVVAVPEPAVSSLLGLGAMLLALWVAKRNRSRQ